MSSLINLMSSQNPLSITQEAQKVLRQFTCINSSESQATHHTASGLLDDALVREALLLVVNHSDYQILGICADHIAQAKQALYTYLTAFGYAEMPDLMETVDGSVYLKYNPRTGLCRAEPYTGAHRGVLVSCQSAYDGDVNETFGHLPIDLFQQA